MMNVYKTSGVCASEIFFEVEGSKIKSVRFAGGCSGNLQGIEKLVTGMEVEEVIDRLEGITCGNRNTSCPWQLVEALKKVKEA